jgi:phage gp29-like protein
MKIKQFIIERVFTQDVIFPLPRYNVRHNVGDGRVPRYEVIKDTAYMQDAIRAVMHEATKGSKSGDIVRAKISITLEKVEGKAR